MVVFATFSAENNTRYGKKAYSHRLCRHQTKIRQNTIYSIISAFCPKCIQYLVKYPFTLFLNCGTIYMVFIAKIKSFSRMKCVKQKHNL